MTYLALLIVGFVGVVALLGRLGSLILCSPNFSNVSMCPTGTGLTVPILAMNSWWAKWACLCLTYLIERENERSAELQNYTCCGHAFLLMKLPKVALLPVLKLPHVIKNLPLFFAPLLLLLAWIGRCCQNTFRMKYHYHCHWCSKLYSPIVNFGLETWIERG